MRFFPELGLCFGGAVVTPSIDAAVAAAAQRQQEPQQSVDASNARRRLAKGNSGKLWKPALSVIAEDGGGGGEHKKKELTRVRSVKKSNWKAKCSAKTQSHNHVDDYRKSCHPMALPAFSPTPFVF